MDDIFEVSLRKTNTSRTPDYWSSDTFPLGKRSPDSDRYTGFRCYIKEPNVEYPDPGFFMQVRGGKGSVFVRTSPTDIRQLAEWLSNIADTAESKSNELFRKSLQCHAVNRIAGTADGLPATSNTNAIPEMMEILSRHSDQLSVVDFFSCDNCSLNNDQCPEPSKQLFKNNNMDCEYHRATTKLTTD